MPETIRDVMAPDPVVIEGAATAGDAAEAMGDHDIGDVVVRGDGRVRAILTDRDVTIRVVAERRNPEAVRVHDICSDGLVTVGPDDTLDHAIHVMRANAIRRLPVVERGRAVGVVSLGDVTLERDEGSALGEISAAPANR